MFERGDHHGADSDVLKWAEINARINEDVVRAKNLAETNAESGEAGLRA